MAKQYNVTVNPAVMAWIGLVGTGAAIYGPRVAIEFAARKAVLEAKRGAQVLETAGTKPAQSMGAQNIEQAKPLFNFN